MSNQCLRTWQPQPTRRSPAGEGRGARMDRLAAHFQFERMLRQIGGRQMPKLHLCTKALSLQLHVLNKLWTLNAVRPAGKILHQRGNGELSTGFMSFN